MEGLSTLERGLAIVGATLMVVCTAGLVYRAGSSRLALREFDQAQAEAATVEDSAAVDFSLWSAKRLNAYRQTLPYKSSAMAVLGVGRLNIRVPVFEGTDEFALNRGVGWIAGTARPGEAGNIGVAGHRDGFFRGLKDVTLGDLIEVSTMGGKAVYAVDQVEIVAPENVGVLRPRDTPSLTLVTCYPFYYVGDAPRRFIVHAALKERAALKQFNAGSPSRTSLFDIKETTK